MRTNAFLELIGRTVTLRVSRKIDAGYILGHGSEELLLPTQLSLSKLTLNQEVSVFVYTDSEDRPIATMQKPLAQVGEFACLKVVDQNQHGCFLDWGLSKDLFCPSSEQHERMKIGQSYVVAVYLDNHTGRVAAASRLAEFFDYDLSSLVTDQKVGVLVYGFQDRGTQVIVDDRYSGMIFKDKNFAALKIGDRLPGYVDGVRADNKLDIRLTETQPRESREKFLDARSVVLSALKSAGGELPLGDKTEPERIYEALGISKKAFKGAVGQLYKSGLVTPGPHSTKLATRGE